MAFRTAASVGTRKYGCRFQLSNSAFTNFAKQVCANTPFNLPAKRPHSSRRTLKAGFGKQVSEKVWSRAKISSTRLDVSVHNVPSNPLGGLLSQGRHCISIKFGSKVRQLRSCVDRTMANSSDQETKEGARKLPVLLFDVMDTLIRDPFYEDMPKFFKLSLKELFAVKHPTAWIEFETGLISEGELLNKFFKDGRDFDLTGLKGCAYEGYRWIEGCEDLLRRLQEAGYEAHAFTNYPHWYRMIEEKFSLSRYLDWTFVSCHTGKRKPDPEAFMEAAVTLGLKPHECVFIDDRLKNVEAAQAVGMAGVLFEDASSLEKELDRLGVHLEPRPVLETSS